MSEFYRVDVAEAGCEHCHARRGRRAMSDLLWWGYRDTLGTVQVKRFWDDRASIDDAYESDFVAEVVEPFPAASRDEALKIVATRTNRKDEL